MITDNTRNNYRATTSLNKIVRSQLLVLFQCIDDKLTVIVVFGGIASGSDFFLVGVQGFSLGEMQFLRELQLVENGWDDERMKEIEVSGRAPVGRKQL